jgi:glycosyltransferase involved in cell wall biosynthesis
VSGIPSVSVVVATHNRAERLAALLEGLRRQTLPRDRFEVIVVDDGSGDATPDVLAAEHARGELPLAFVRHHEGRGPATARNRGWRLASAPLIAFTDDDCVPTPGWLDALLRGVAGRDDAIVQGRTLPHPAEAGHLGPFAKTMEITGPGPHFETCNIAYPRALLERLGGFDEGFPSPTGEDSDLGSRAIAAGAVAGFEAEALVHHAVFERGPLEALRDALLATDDLRAYRLNPELRSNLPMGIFYDRSHPLLMQAAAAALLSWRRPTSILFCAPYAANLLGRCRAAGAPPWHAPYLVAFDALQIAATARGAVRERVTVI